MRNGPYYASTEGQKHFCVSGRNLQITHICFRVFPTQEFSSCSLALLADLCETSALCIWMSLNMCRSVLWDCRYDYLRHGHIGHISPHLYCLKLSGWVLYLEDRAQNLWPDSPILSAQHQCGNILTALIHNCMEEHGRSWEQTDTGCISVSQISADILL